MVRLTRIYTRTGDDGTTGLGDGSRTRKTSLRIEAYGTVDELGASLGVVLALGSLAPARAALLREIQNDLFDLGADLCVPEEGGRAAGPKGRATPPLRLRPERVDRLEKAIDAENASLAPLRSFVLAGGTPAAAGLHVARTVCRRTERAAWRLAEAERVNDAVLRYLNRLSDLLFVLARAENDGGTADVLWEPGKGSGT